MDRTRRTFLAVALTLAASFAIALGAGGAGGVGDAAFGPAAARAMGPLPACRYDDIFTAPRGYGDWAITLVDPILRVSSSYIPPDLVPVSEAGLAGTGKVRAVAIADLTDMTAAAKANGTPIGVQSAYRSYTQQKSTFAYWVKVDGYQGALKVSARPGHSEHQLGVAIDFKSDNGGPPWQGGDWALSPAGFWMKANAWKYGWVMSYPRNDFARVCYAYEPWHYRYLGKELAKKLHDSKLTIREYLWANFTTAEVPPPANPTPKPVVTPGTSTASAPTPIPTSTPSATASPEPSPTLEVPGSLPPPATTTPTATAAPASDDPFGGANASLVASGAIGAVAAALVLIGLLAARGWRRRGPS
jgi:zinc D-Ala-D-Ala carboxypeptidase